MSKILLAGIGPIPSQGAKQLFAPGLRVWIFATVLARAGHEVRLALGDFANPQSPAVQLFDVVEENQTFTTTRIPLSEAMTLEKSLCSAVDLFGADCIVTTTDVMANAVAGSGSSLPLWIDFYGSPMAERQQQAALHRHDGGLAAAWRMILPALLRGDHFSACSDWQRLAMIGELGACGRLNSLTAGHEMVSSIPPGVALPPFDNGAATLRGSIVPEEAFVILWTGGFNTWTDVQTLHAGLAAAMEQDPRIHFISTGGAIPGHCEGIYPAFETLVAQGQHRERFHLLGWVDLDVVRHAWHEADLAVNIDTFSYEGLLGTRTRLLDWMQAGLPIATTVLAELTDILAKRSLVYPFEIGNAQDLSRVILAALHDPVERRSKGRQAREFLQREWSNEQLLAPLLAWAEKPKNAPDRAGSAAIAPNTLASAQLDILEGSALRDELESVRAQNARLEQQLSRMKGSRVIKALMKLKKWEK